MGTKIKGQYMNRSTFWIIKYMNGSVFSKVRYMNRVGFEILTRTPVPKLPLGYPPTRSVKPDIIDGTYAARMKYFRSQEISESYELTKANFVLF